MSKPSKSLTPLRIIGIYVVVGALWMLFWGQLAGNWSTDSVIVAQLRAYQGWLFIAVTAAMLHILIQRNNAMLRRMHARCVGPDPRVLDNLSDGKHSASPLTLQESQRVIETLMDNLPGMAYRGRNDPDWSMEFISRGFSRLTGYERSQLIETKELSFVDLIEPQDREGVWACVQQALEEKRPYQLTYRIRTATGAVKWVWEQGRGVFTEKGVLSALEGLILDISVLKRMEHALRASEAKIRLITDNMPAGMSYVDCDEIYRYHNRTFAEWLDLEPDQIDGRSIREVLGPDTYAAIKDRVAAALSGKDVQYEREQTIAGGAGRHWSVRYVPQFGADDAVVGCIAMMTDVTQRKAAEERLRQSEELLRQTLENTPTGIGTTDLRGRFVSVNPALCTILGYSAAELLTMAVLDIVHPEDFPSIESLHRSLLRGEIPDYELEKRYVRKDGGILTACTRVRLVRNAQGEPVIAVGDVEDITERKQTQAALRNLAASTAVSGDSDFVARCVTALAETYEAKFAFAGVFADKSRSSIRTLALWEGTGLVANMVYGLECTPCQDVLEGKVELIPCDAAKLYSEDAFLADRQAESYFGAPMISSSGEVVGLVSVLDTKPMQPGVWARPVLGTFANRMALELERQQTDDEMTRLRLYLKNIIDSMPSVLVGVDSAGAVNEWNRHAEQMTGLSRDLAMGRSFEEVLPQLASQLDEVRHAIHTHQPMKSARLRTETDGVTRYTDLMVYPLYANGTVGAVIRMDDVTARIRIEEMMVQTEKMMSVGGLAAGMAHEINNPLGAIVQSCQNISRRLSPELGKNLDVSAALGIDLNHVTHYLNERGILRFLETIRESGLRAAQIVGDMLAYSRHSELTFSPTDVGAMLDTSVRLATSDYDLKKEYDFKHILIERDYDPGLPEVPCDKTEIEQVIINLLRNAAQAMTGHPPPHRIVLRTTTRSGRVRIEVIDNGPGMDEKTRKRVFEPFFTTKDIGVGTGLGLSVSYFIVTEQHRGTMSVETTPGHGARFIIELPLER